MLSVLCSAASAADHPCAPQPVSGEQRYSQLRSRLSELLLFTHPHASLVVVLVAHYGDVSLKVSWALRWWHGGLGLLPGNQWLCHLSESQFPHLMRVGTIRLPWEPLCVQGRDGPFILTQMGWSLVATPVRSQETFSNLACESVPCSCDKIPEANN